MKKILFYVVETMTGEMYANERSYYLIPKSKMEIYWKEKNRKKTITKLKDLKLGDFSLILSKKPIKSKRILFSFVPSSIADIFYALKEI